MLPSKMIALSLTALLAVSGCVKTTGDFCDIARPIRFDRAVSEAVVKGDRASAEVIDAHNRYGEGACGW